jgi:PIN domain nuclease of toxin-antitoxin system
MLVADTSAALAILKGEPGAAEAEGLIRGGVIGMANLVEAVTRGQEFGVAPAVTLSAFSIWGVEIAAVDRATADQAMTLWPLRKQGLSLGDRLCIGLALSRGLSVLTGDRRWRQLGLDVKVVLFR